MARVRGEFPNGSSIIRTENEQYLLMPRPSSNSNIQRPTPSNPASSVPVKQVQNNSPASNAIQQWTLRPSASLTNAPGQNNKIFFIDDSAPESSAKRKKKVQIDECLTCFRRTMLQRALKEAAILDTIDVSYYRPTVISSMPRPSSNSTIQRPTPSNPASSVPVEQVQNNSPASNAIQQWTLRPSTSASSTNAPGQNNNIFFNTFQPSTGGGSIKMSTVAPQQPQSVVVGTATQPSGQISDPKRKCIRLLKMLMKMTKDKGDQTLTQNISELIHSLLIRQITSSIFTEKLLQYFPPHPRLLPFLERTIPIVQNAFAAGEFSIEGLPSIWGPNLQQSSNTNEEMPMAPEGPLTSHDLKTKCVTLLQGLLRNANNKGEAFGNEITELISGLLCRRITPLALLEKLSEVFHIQDQPRLISFFESALPAVEESFNVGEITMADIRGHRINVPLVRASSLIRAFQSPPAVLVQQKDCDIMSQMQNNYPKSNSVMQNSSGTIPLNYQQIRPPSNIRFVGSASTVSSALNLQFRPPLNSSSECASTVSASAVSKHIRPPSSNVVFESASTVPSGLNHQFPPPSSINNGYGSGPDFGSASTVSSGLNQQIRPITNSSVGSASIITSSAIIRLSRSPFNSSVGSTSSLSSPAYSQQIRPLSNTVVVSRKSIVSSSASSVPISVDVTKSDLPASIKYSKRDILRVAYDELACCICLQTSVEPSLCKDCHQIVGCGACVDDWLKKSKMCPKCRGASGFIRIRGLNEIGKMLREDEDMKDNN